MGEKVCLVGDIHLQSPSPKNADVAYFPKLSVGSATKRIGNDGRFRLLAPCAEL